MGGGGLFKASRIIRTRDFELASKLNFKSRAINFLS